MKVLAQEWVPIAKASLTELLDEMERLRRLEAAVRAHAPEHFAQWLDAISGVRRG